MGNRLSARWKVELYPPQSTLLDFEELGRYGWTIEQLEVESFHDLQSMAVVMQFLGTNPNTDIATVKENWKHSRSWTDAQGRQVLPTYGYYKNDYNIDHGFIVAEQIFAPSYEGPQQIPAVTNYPILQYWSDVSFIIYATKCNFARKPLGSFRAVLQHAIANAPTERIILQALRAIGSEDFTEWPGVTFNSLNFPDEFAAILGTPNGRGTAWMLLQHRAQFGWKTVVGIRVWHYAIKNQKGEEFYERNMLLLIEDFRPTILSVPDGEHTYQEDIDYGKWLICKLGDRGERQSVFDAPGSFKTYGWQLSEPQPLIMRPGMHLVLALFGSVDALVTSLVCRHSLPYRIFRTQFEPTGGYFELGLRTQLGVIFAGNGVSPKKAAARQTPPMNAPPPTHLQAWSDVAFMSWLHVCIATNRPPQSLRAVVYSIIQNDETYRVISDALFAAVGSRTATAFPGTVFAPELHLNEFHALVGTPVGRGTAWMLAQHQRGQYALGRKKISSVQVYCDSCGAADEQIYILINIIDFDVEMGKRGAELDNLAFETNLTSPIESDDGVFRTTFKAKL